MYFLMIKVYLINFWFWLYIVDRNRELWLLNTIMGQELEPTCMSKYGSAIYKGCFTWHLLHLQEMKQNNGPTLSCSNTDLAPIPLALTSNLKGLQNSGATRIGADYKKCIFNTILNVFWQSKTKQIRLKDASQQGVVSQLQKNICRNWSNIRP